MAHEPYIRDVPGSRFAVLMLHGIVGTPDHFTELIPMIPEGWSVYNILLDGHGQGVKEFGATSMEKWKNQVKTTLEDIFARHERVVLVAHSMGTLFSIQAALDDPRKVARLFLLAVPTRPRLTFTAAVTSLRLALGDERSKKAQAMKKASSVELDWRLWRYIPWIGRFWELLTECRRVRKALPRLAVPCDAFQSKHDELVGKKACKDMAASAWVELTVLPDSGHFDYGPVDMELLRKRLKERLEQVEKTAP